MYSGSSWGTNDVQYWQILPVVGNRKHTVVCTVHHTVSHVQPFYITNHPIIRTSRELAEKEKERWDEDVFS